VDAFWSITLYDKEGFQVQNSLERFAVSSWMRFKHNSGDSLDLYFQNASPGSNEEANWLPTPKGPFSLTMRLYAPKSDVLTGKWTPPAVMKVAQSRLSPARYLPSRQAFVIIGDRRMLDYTSAAADRSYRGAWVWRHAATRVQQHGVRPDTEPPRRVDVGPRVNLACARPISGRSPPRRGATEVV
jgi:hypothetical protein